MAATGIERRSFLGIAGAILLKTLPGAAEQEKRPRRKRPNIVLILADDLGYGDLGCYGCPDIRTPVIDGLAGEGVRFTNFYANGPECTPTRTALLTGRYQQRVGGLECAIGFGNAGRYDDALRLEARNELGLPVEETSIASMVKDAGYATGMCGKWHLGYEPKFSPNKHGFDYAFGTLGGGVDYFHHTEPQGWMTLQLDGRFVRRDGYMTDLITDEAVNFIKRHQHEAFFLYVPYTAPHFPYQRPDDRRDKPLPVEDFYTGSRETYAAMVQHMDRGIGLILSALDEAGLADNTLVIFASDNGADERGRNHPFRGLKSGLFEGGIRVPCITKWPGVLPSGTVSDHPTLMMDLTVSIARIADATPIRPFDGIDILEALEKDRSPVKRALFWRARRGYQTWRAVRDGNLKYVSRQDGTILRQYLFDLEKDPGEESNLIEERGADAKRLEQLLLGWEDEVRPAR